MAIRLPWAHEELKDLQQRLDANIHATEQENPEIRPLPAMDEDQSRELLLALTDTAKERLLTGTEVFLIGQLLSVYRMAVEARMLGRNGRYFVFSQDDLERMIKER